ncbi:MAG: four helix bundle suffix domain-containing protein [Bacteroidaceae bacterium]|nr:four helix bundle suffix domain-containing protein [Bacteroidaceae bacterium]
MNESTGDKYKVMRTQVFWEELYFYQKSVVLYQLTYIFIQRYLKRGDRTIDQMLQAARSGKQNIVEGSADGVTSMEMELKLLNVARASLKELREDYEDYILSRKLTRWDVKHPRYDTMLKFCRKHNKWDEYSPYVDKWNDEEIANICLTLCHMVDKMMMTYQEKLEKDFVANGGIKERMAAARMKYRTDQKEEIERLRRRVAYLESKLIENGIEF